MANAEGLLKGSRAVERIRGDFMPTFVLWTETGKEEHLAQVLTNTIVPAVFETAPASVYVPMKKRYYGNRKDRRQGADGTNTDGAWVLDRLFPSYVFIDTENIGPFRSRLYEPRIETNYYLLSGREQDIRHVSEDEMTWISRLMSEEKIVEPSFCVMENGRAVYTDGPLVGMEGIVKKVDLHKRMAVVELMFLGEKRSVTVPVEMIRPAALKQKTGCSLGQ